MAKSDYWRNKILDLVRGQPITPPATLHLALFKGKPGAGGVEVSNAGVTGYQRFSIASTLNDWNATQGGTGSASSGTTGRISNASIIQFGQPLTDWATSAAPLTHWALMDAFTGGNVVYDGVLSQPKIVLAGSPALNFPADALGIYEV